MNRRAAAIVWAVWLAASTGACATGAVFTRQDCGNAAESLNDWLRRYEAEKARGCSSAGGTGSTACLDLQPEVERLSLSCPAHVPTLMANAVVAHERGQRARAQQLLDQVLERPGLNPPAAALRARIAIEEGNLPFARRFLEEQIKSAPNSAELRELHGAALYLSSQLDQARRELRAAGALGAPDWRVAYHLGLVEEAAGNLDAAIAHYADAVSRNAQWKPAQDRLDALRKNLAPSF
jgi:predicted Zn-dependent protease